MGALEERAGHATGVEPAIVEARLMPWAAGLSVVSWGFAVLVGLTIFYFGLVMGGIVPWLALPLTVTGILFAAFCGWRFIQAWRVRRADRPVVSIGPQGYHDARLGGTVPWGEIEGLAVDQPGTRTFLRISARDPARFVARGRRLKRRVAREGVLVSCLSELDATPQSLVAAAEAYRAAA